VRVRRSTWIWLAVLAAAAIPAAALGPTGEDGCLHGLLVGVALLAFLVLAARGSMAAFRAITRRLTLRLAFSYFLIGIVPIPLLAALLSLAGYLVAHQYAANRLRREITAVGEAAVRSRAPLPAIEVADDGRIVASDLAWLRPGTPAPWLRDLPRPVFSFRVNRPGSRSRRGRRAASASCG
jgi:hypothetical protein